MPENEILIGTGFFATPDNVVDAGAFLKLWMENTERVCGNIVVTDNSQAFFATSQDYVSARSVRILKNLGHACWPMAQTAKTPLLGWSISWMIPALLAYSEGCDFVYKEQDCLAFGDWLPVITPNGLAQMTIGRHSTMPCEQSLFYIRHGFILPFLRDYMLLGMHDAVMVTEEKFRRIKDSYGDAITFHDLPGGRNRPMPDLSKPFYLQKITSNEMNILKSADLI